MPVLTDREVAYVRDEQALYIGTAEGNLQLCTASAAGRLTALEAADKTRGESMAELETTQKSLGQALTAQENAVTAQGQTLTAQGERLAALEAAQKTQGEAVAKLQTEKLTAAPMAALAALAADAELPAVVAAYNDLIAGLKTAGMMN